MAAAAWWQARMITLDQAHGKAHNCYAYLFSYAYLYGCLTNTQGLRFVTVTIEKPTQFCEPQLGAL